MKVVTVVGARPQFIKASVVSRLITSREGVSEILIHTGQHYDENMSAIFFGELDIPAPAHSLGIGSGPHGMMTGRMLEAIEGVLLEEQPDWVLVYGDTNSTLAGAIAAAKLHIPLAHVEAGLRSFNRRMPEEINRVLTDHAATALFAPTEAAVQNLAAEGVASQRVHQVGDLMFDATLFFSARAAGRMDSLGRHGVRVGGYVLATIHRAENTDDPTRLAAIIGGLRREAERRPVVWPLHPRTRNVLRQLGAGATGAITVIPPVGYLDMIALERGAALIVTDSGGVQKEAFFLGVPCVTLRDETEWVELVTAGANRVVPPVNAAVVAEAIGAPASFPAAAGSPYGDGHAGERIIDALLGA